MKDARDVVENLHDVIGVLREGPLHRDLKGLLAAPGDAFEVKVDGYVIDLVRAGGELVEIQTGGFSPLRKKLDALLDRHPIRIVHPIPARRRIIRVDEDGEVLSTKRLAEEAGRGDDLRGARLLPHAAQPPEPDDRGPAVPRGPRPQARARPRPPLPARSRRAAPDRGARADRAHRPEDAARADPGLRRALHHAGARQGHARPAAARPEDRGVPAGARGDRARRHARPRAAAPGHDLDWRAHDGLVPSRRRRPRRRARTDRGAPRRDRRARRAGTTTFYDTFDGRLHAAGLTLRHAGGRLDAARPRDRRELATRRRRPRARSGCSTTTSPSRCASGSRT